MVTTATGFGSAPGRSSPPGRERPGAGTLDRRSAQQGGELPGDQVGTSGYDQVEVPGAGQDGEVDVVAGRPRPGHEGLQVVGWDQQILGAAEVTGDERQRLPVLVYQLLGFELVSSMAGELKDPRRHIPRAIGVSGVLLGALYLFSTVGILIALPPKEIGLTEGFVDTFKAVFGNGSVFVWVLAAWGGLGGGLYFPWDRDERVAPKVIELEGADRYCSPFVLEGGSTAATAGTPAPTARQSRRSARSRVTRSSPADTRADTNASISVAEGRRHLETRKSSGIPQLFGVLRARWSPDTGCMTSIEANKDLVRAFIGDLFTEGDPRAVDHYLAEDFVNHDPPFGVSSDREGMRSAGAMFRKAFPDWHSDLHLLVGEGDIVVERFVASGTQRGEIMGVAPTGRTISLPGINIFRIHDGRIVERWGRLDDLGLLQQLGLAPHP